MGSQQARQSGERQSSNFLVTIASREDPPDQLLASMDRQLYDVSAVINNARKALFDYSTTLTASNKKCAEFERAYGEERQYRIDQSRAYTDLHSRYLALQQQLEGERQAREASSLMVKEKDQYSEAEVTRVASKDHQLNQSGWDMTKPGIEIEQLKARIRELEQENAGKSQEHEERLTSAVDHIHTVTQKVDEVEKTCQPTSAEHLPASVSTKAETDDKGESGQRRGRAKRARMTKQATE